MFESFGVINIWTYIAGLIFIILAPGPNSLYVLKTGASYGIATGYRAASGVLLGDAILILLSYPWCRIIGPNFPRFVYCNALYRRSLPLVSWCVLDLQQLGCPES